jgi:hypothetical protein
MLESSQGFLSMIFSLKSLYWISTGQLKNCTRFAAVCRDESDKPGLLKKNYNPAFSQQHVAVKLVFF